MGTYYYWVHDELNIYVCLERYNDLNYDEELYEDFFKSLGEYNNETSKIDEAFTERTLKDLTIKDLTNVLISAKRYQEIMYHSDRDLFIFLLNRFLGNGRIITEHDEEFPKIEKSYKDLTKKD